MVQKFMQDLADALSALPGQERGKVLEYYWEMIEDKRETGIEDPQIVNEFGPVEEIADKTLMEFGIAPQQIPQPQPENSAPQKKRTLRNGFAVTGIVVLSPIILSLAAVTLVLILCVFLLIFCLWIMGVSFAAAAVVYLVPSVVRCFSDPAVGFFQIGVCLLFGGMSIFSILAGIKSMAAWIRCLKRLPGLLRNRKDKMEKGEEQQ